MKKIDNNGRLIPYQKSIHGELTAKGYKFPTKKHVNLDGTTELVPYPRSRDFKINSKAQRRGRTLQQLIIMKDGTKKSIWHYPRNKFSNN